MTKIIEKIIEPSHIEVGSKFKLKIKAIRYTTYLEIKEKAKYGRSLSVLGENKKFLNSYKYSELKGE